MGRWFGVVVFVVACGGAATAPRLATVEKPQASKPPEDRDRDHDGIPNECDACPDAPENYNGRCDDDGCPDGCVLSFEPAVINLPLVIAFTKQSTKIDGDAQPLVDDIARTLVTQADALELVAIVGHASHDETGGVALALARANAMKAALVAKHADASHLVTLGVGTREANDKDESRNRRVTFVVLRADGREQYRIDGSAIIAIAPPQPPHEPPPCEPIPATCKRADKT